MLFHTTTFAIFFLLVFGGYLLLARSYKLQNILLLIASYVFYGWWDIRFLFLIIVSTAIDYSCGLLIARGELNKQDRAKASLWVIAGALLLVLPDWASLKEYGIAEVLKPTPLGVWTMVGTVGAVAACNLFYPVLVGLGDTARRKAGMALSLVANLGMLGFFKYFNFFAESVQAGFDRLGWEVNPILLQVVLPMGISFYTFQTLSYTIDIYRRKLEPTRDFTAFALFVAFFPQLVAGPIERASHLLPQMMRPRKILLPEFHAGLYLILWGLFKKLVIADNMAPLCNEVYNHYGEVQGPSLILATIAFAFQIYCDFSAYSDIARGTGKLLGFDLMVNFRLPYFAVSPSDFWRRWHISLSTWLRDYLYIPLGGNRGGSFNTQRNLMITMLLGGLWHGASWNFVLWGFFHGLILAIYRIADRRPMDAPVKTFGERFGYLVRIAIMLVLTLIGWVLFRATGVRDDDGVLIHGSMDQIAHVLTAWASAEQMGRASHLAVLVGFYAAPLVLVQIAQHRSRDLMEMTRLPWAARGVWYGLLVSAIFVLGATDAVEFIYFQF